ncbi:MAG: hypothetical protein KR126chlam4_00231 [Candidatus Anoxychlamydiales bacterium]|nr:hypothetical protein [Candidatus Anoxychlamydiales bacterium]HEU63780.1 hypothetical protein [Chlamydiota bacterium]
MRKKIILLSIIFSFLFSNYLEAEVVEVPKLTEEQEKATKKKNWQPWAIAIVSILFAVTGIAILKSKKGKSTS